MTFLKDKKQSAIAPVRQRRTESPRFWLILGGGSIALHLVLLLGLRWMNFRTTVATSNTNPTSIEVIELAPDAIAPSSESETAAPSVENQPAPSAPAAPPAQSAPIDTSIVAAPPEVTSPEVTPTPVPEGGEAIAPPSPTPSPFTPPPIPAPSASPNPTLPPSPPAESQPVPTPPETQIPPSTPLPSNPTPELPSGQSSSLPDPTGESDSSGQPDQTGISEPGIGESQGGLIEGLPPVPTYEAPPSFTASISVSPPNTAIPQQIAEPIESSRAFLNDGSQTACSATAGVTAAWNQPVQFRVRIDRTAEDPNLGRVASNGVETVQRSGNDEYDALADCLLREWVFRPPDTDAAIENEAPSSEVVVTVEINPG